MLTDKMFRLIRMQRLCHLCRLIRQFTMTFATIRSSTPPVIRSKSISVVTELGSACHSSCCASSLYWQPLWPICLVRPFFLSILSCLFCELFIKCNHVGADEVFKCGRRTCAMKWDLYLKLLSCWQNRSMLF